MTDSFNDILNTYLSKKNNDIFQDSDVCLISNEPLEENCITLSCGHRFNYNPLYKEITQQKNGSNYLEVTKVKLWEIKCPYCRNVQNKILPFKNNFPKIAGVNWPIKYCMNVSKCKYIFSSGKKKGLKCDKLWCSEYCNSHYKIMERRKEKEKQKQQEKQNKINTLLTTQVLDNKFRCAHILLSGKNKGTQCKRNKSVKNSANIYCSIHSKYWDKVKCKPTPSKNVKIKINTKTQKNLTNYIIENLHK
mgnify:CR=1 FL=1